MRSWTVLPSLRHPFYKKSVQFSSTLKSIGNGAFYNSGLEEISFPDSLEVIHENAFDNKNYLIEEVILPESLKTIPPFIFEKIVLIF